jgi:hypothetical protein
MTDIDALNLAPVARAAAIALRGKHPGVKFTSGRRAVADQARAMAQNVIKNRKWIAQTYVSTAESRELQAEVDKFGPHATVEAIAGALEALMEDWTDAQKGRVSKHFSGEAFDVQPIPGAKGEAIKAAIRKLPGLTKFLESEGGLIRWHAQFA